METEQSTLTSDDARKLSDEAYEIRRRIAAYSAGGHPTDYALSGRLQADREAAARIEARLLAAGFGNDI
jgi:hypothetical protein